MKMGLLLTWVPYGQLSIFTLRDRRSSIPHPEETALCGLQVALSDGMKCIVRL